VPFAKTGSQKNNKVVKQAKGTSSFEKKEAVSVFLKQPLFNIRY